MSLSNTIPISELPVQLSPAQAVDLAYPEELSAAVSSLSRGLPVLLDCDKDQAPYVYISLRTRLKVLGLKCDYLDGRSGDSGAGCTFTSILLNQIRDAVRGSVEKRVLVLPHLDLMTTSQGGLTSEAREIIPLLYENPEILWLGFRDPSFSIPKVIENLFPHRYAVLGVPRHRLRYLVTQKAARKFTTEGAMDKFNPWFLYKYVSGVNAVKLHRLLDGLVGEDYPQNPAEAIKQIRQVTLSGNLEVPQVDLEKDIGGYAKVKHRLRSEVLEILSRKDSDSSQMSPAELARLESLVPRGMIFWGPPGTGKTLFAKALATALGAAVSVVSGPELKSKWVGESEENLRQLFHRARVSAPSVIVFDELDSFASARGTYTGSGVEHSMVNQLLTEMDGFRSGELVFVIGTTNFVEILDPALMRPGRFEFLLHIPYPEAEDRREILRVSAERLKMELDETALDYAVKRTSDQVEGASPGTRFSGDHLHALCRGIARIKLRENQSRLVTIPEIDRALSEWIDRPTLTAREELVVASHEAGHAICSMFCPNATPIDRISIRADISGALGYVRHKDPANKYVTTQGQLEDDLCILMGGREAERILLGEISAGCASDLDRATSIAQAMIEEYGMGESLSRSVSVGPKEGRRALSPSVLEEINRETEKLLKHAMQRARVILDENRVVLETLRDLLVKEKILESDRLSELMSSRKTSNN